MIELLKISALVICFSPVVCGIITGALILMYEEKIIGKILKKLSRE